jgi:SAM-dependent methyltransferase/uncharacterized protein YbaR (Trm112 family)
MIDKVMVGQRSQGDAREWSGTADDVWQCPQCGQAPLHFSEAAVACTACQKRWPVNDGVPLLCRQQHDTYQADELSIAAAAQLVREAPLRGWRAALDQALETLTPAQAEYLERYVCSQSRALLLDLLDLPDDAVVLDHGCGWGNQSFHLAQKARRVVSMDLVGHRAKFTEIRAAQEGSANVVPVVSGDYERLPFRDGTFDAVLLNGVLEWVPCVLDGNPKAIQEKRLREIVRVLKPAGQLVWAIENRFWYRYFLGNPEVHTGVHWASLVPRWVANFLARRKGRPGFRTLTYSLRGSIRLLRRAGFASVEPFVTLPEYNFPDIIVPAYDRASMRRALDMLVQGKRRKRLARLAARLGLYPHVAYCFAFVGHKGAD